MKKHSNIAKLNNAYTVHQEESKEQRRRYRYQVHVRRAQWILAVFIAAVFFFGFQLYTCKRQLASVNHNIASARTELQAKKDDGQSLNRQIKRLHNPNYLQEVLRQKYRYHKDGETLYSFVK